MTQTKLPFEDYTSEELDVLYPNWDETNTRVVSGPYGGPDRHEDGGVVEPVKKPFPGKWFATYQEAKAYWTRRAGRIVGEHLIRGRYIFRIPLGPLLPEEDK